MSALSCHAGIQAAAGHPRPFPPTVRRLQLHPLPLEGRQLGGARASLEESLQEEKQEGGTEAGEEEEEKEKEGAKDTGHGGALCDDLAQPSANRAQLRSEPQVVTLK